MYDFLIDQNRLRYHDIHPDNEEAILFIHGLGCAGSFEYVRIACAPELRKYRKIVVDLIGFGYSDKPDDFDYSVDRQADILAELLDHLGIDKIIVYGHSMGGAVVLSLAHAVPEKIQFLIIAEGNLDSGGGFISKKIAAQQLDEFVDEGYNQFVQHEISRGQIDWAVSLHASSPYALHGMSKSLVQGGRSNWRQTLYFNKHKSAFLFGEKSLPSAEYDILLNDAIHVNVVPDAGHGMSFDNPVGVVRAICSVL